MTMSYRDILVHLDAEPAGAAGNRRRQYAISLAAALKGHLTGLVFDLEPVVHGVSLGSLPNDFTEAMRREGAEAARLAADAFTSAARAEAVECEPRVVHARLGEAPDRLASHGRVCDLIMLGQRDRESTFEFQDELIKAALFESGRPVLIGPYVGYDATCFERVIVAWDGRREAARAAHDALPLLTRACSVEVLVIGDKSIASRSEEPGVDLALHLARHGVSVTTKRIGIADIDIGNAARSHAADYGADLLVMGGFARARLAQLILGGMTRSVLDSMTLPVVMSH
jgi:nucleotide-binding universal stress UspA family protein